MKLRSSGMSAALFLALLMLLANPARPAAEPFPTATPESQGLSSQSLGKLLDVVRGFVEHDEIVGGELLVIKNRRTVLHEVQILGEVLRADVRHLDLSGGKDRNASEA